MDAKIKAILIAEGSAEIDLGLLARPAASTTPMRSDTSALSSTAGPGAGLSSFFFESGGTRVRLDATSDPDAHLRVRLLRPDVGVEDAEVGTAKVGIAEVGVANGCEDVINATERTQSPLESTSGSRESHSETGNVVIFYDDRELVRGRIEPALLHCPFQAYITMSESCVFDCTFCPVPKLAGRTKSVEEVVRMVDDASRTGNLHAISITSGIKRSPEEEVTRAVEVVKSLTKYDIPIGVSVYPTADSSLRLKEAGAVEIKYNVETMDREIFGRVCADMDLDFVLAALEDAVGVFGRNRVFSNIIIGLGESDETVKRGVREIIGMGVIPILRALNLHPLRRADLLVKCPDAARPTADRLLALARFERKVLDAHGLRADVAETMCLPCGGCDLVPHRDV